MIENIILASEGSYDAAGTKLENLKKANFLFGSNGSGKTTISRVIEGSGSFPNCQVNWTGDIPLETCVYNKDFVEQHFDLKSNIRGIYTFGENIEVVDKIKNLKDEADEIKKKIYKLRPILFGGDEAAGKIKEKEAVSAQFVADIWSAKAKIDGLKAAFVGLNNNKKKFSEQYLIEASSNTADLKITSELCEGAETIFSKSLIKANILPIQDSSKILELERSAILKKKIIGKEDVDISALIKILGNSDWVQQGLQYFEHLEDRCPFCQQKTDANFKQSLEAYFDESYTTDLASIGKLIADYGSAGKNLLEAYDAIGAFDSPYFTREDFNKDVVTLRLALRANFENIAAKRKEPSAVIEINDTTLLIAAVNAHISKANEKIKENNDTITNLAVRKKELTSQIWKRLLEDTKDTYNDFKTKIDGIDKAIEALSIQIDKKTEELKKKEEEIEENEKKITSIKPAIDGINKLLKSFGFTNFYLTESAESGFYEVKRLNGEDAKQTLSEGEKSFITFLYFYYLVGGSFNSSGGMNDKVVVFDDPVSSLDTDILFIVCNLIKLIVAEMRAETNSIKQVLVLTHNIYFHKEITFDKKRNAGKAKNDETFWVVRKTSKGSELVAFQENPIKSSYELLWQEIKQKPPSDTAIQNVMRRILEHYFKFYGGINPEEIISKFDGRDKIICGTLLSWVNDGSHFATDDLYMSCDSGQIDRYLNVFQRIFEGSDHGGHFKMMMGDDYVALPIDDA